MRERDLREAVHQHLSQAHVPDCETLIFDEFSIDGLDRIDLATVNAALTGYELKSATDTLTRLARQAPSYSRVMDYLFLVTTTTHLQNARRLIPGWWGIIIAKESSEGISLRQSRSARQNPKLDAMTLARLLWRDEALAILTTKGLDKGYRTRTRSDLCGRLAKELELAELSYEVREKIKERQGWRESPALQQSGATSPLEDRTPRFLARRYRPPRQLGIDHRR